MREWVSRDGERRVDIAVLTLWEHLQGVTRKRQTSPSSHLTFSHPILRQCQQSLIPSLGMFPDSYRLTVEVRDSQGLRASTYIEVNIVNINDEIPRFTR